MFAMELRGLLVVEDLGDGRGEPAIVPATEYVANRPIAHHVLDALEAVGVGEVVGAEDYTHRRC